MNAMCGRCHRVVPVAECEAVAGVVMCRSCKEASVNDAEADAMVRELAHSTGRRQIAIGIFLIAAGIALLAVGLSLGSFVVVPVGILAAGVVELVRGAMRLST